MLVGHKTFYVKGGKLARCSGYFGDGWFIKSPFLEDVFKHYNHWIEVVLNGDEEMMSYIIFYDDGYYTNGFLTLNQIKMMQILTEDDLMIKDIIE